MSLTCEQLTAHRHGLCRDEIKEEEQKKEERMMLARNRKTQLLGDWIYWECSSSVEQQLEILISGTNVNCSQSQSNWKEWLLPTTNNDDDNL